MYPHPQAQINYLLKHTDHIGLIEHCHFDQPNFAEGYCVDDNARALQVCLRLRSLYPTLNQVLPRYFKFLQSAFQKNILYNDLNFNQTWLKNPVDLGEHYGRTLAALGEIIKFEPKYCPEAQKLFDQIYSSFFSKTSPYPRVSAQIISGLQYYHSDDIPLWADSLLSLNFQHQNVLSYDNARLPLALLIAFRSTSQPKYLEVAINALDYLTDKFFDSKNNYFTFSSNKSPFPQQPIEAGSATEAYSLAFQITQKNKYKNLALTAFDWYYGQNILKSSLINPQSGGIFDGLEKNGPNLNQGAESLLSYLLAFASLINLS